MHPQTLLRLQQNRDDTKPANWVEVSADDVLDATDGLDPPDQVTSLLRGAADRSVQGRVMPRRGPPPRRPIIVHRKDLEHLLSRAESAARDRAEQERRDAERKETEEAVAQAVEARDQGEEKEGQGE